MTPGTDVVGGTPTKAETPQSPTIGYLVSTWPRLSATFILNEVIAVERSGVAVRIFSVKDPDGEPVHPAVAQVAARVCYLSLPRHRKAAVHANLRVLCRHPGRYCRTLLCALRFRRGAVLRSVCEVGYLTRDLLREP